MDDPVAVGGLADVALVHRHRRAPGTELAGELVGRLSVAAVPGGDMYPGAGQCCGDGGADAARAARHDRYSLTVRVVGHDDTPISLGLSARTVILGEGSCDPALHCVGEIGPQPGGWDDGVD